MASLELKVENVKCGGCASAIQDGLKNMKGVSGIEVDVANGTVRIQGEDIDTAAIHARLAELGYPVAA